MAISEVGRCKMTFVKRFIKFLLGGRNEHWGRWVMNMTTRKWVEELAPGSLTVLEISGQDWKIVPFKSYRSVSYPGFDICRDVLSDQFDLIIAEQVFEHLPYPYRAAKNVLHMLKSGGCFLITTPFLIKIHNSPIDCSRWTETGMRYFLEECGFPPEQIRAGSWGNRRCVIANLRRFYGYWGALHSLKNEPDFPVVVWALAKRP